MHTAQQLRSTSHSTNGYTYQSLPDNKGDPTIKHASLEAFLGHINATPEPVIEDDDEDEPEPSWQQQAEARISRNEADIEELKAQLAALTKIPVAHGEPK